MFGQNKRRNVIECYRAKEFSPSYEINQKTNRKIQKDVLRKSARISPRNYDAVSAYTGPIETSENATDPYKYHRSSRIRKKGKKVIYDLCECYDDITDDDLNGKYQPKTWESITEWYGNADTTEVWPDPNHQIEVDEENRSHKNTNKKHKRRKSKTHKKPDHNYDQQQNNPNSSAFDTSVISLYLKCPQGRCASAKAMGNKNFLCKCDNRKREPITEECTDATCDVYRNPISINSVVKLKDNILCLCRKYSQNFLNKKAHGIIPESKDHKSKKSKKQALKTNHIEIIKAHECEQTGGPFFEVKVNPRDMCVLNPMEIKENILKYGITGKREPSCICPSRGRLRSGEVCESGICKKAFKNKQVNFSCRCDKKHAECGDATCDIINLRNNDKKLNKGKHVSFQKANKPLLEVQLDMDKMCVVNRKEIQEKIMNNVSPDEICSSGICRNAALKHKIPFTCKCISKKLHSEITECSEDTCKDITKKKRSKFCLFCTRICSKSENWPYKNRDQRRVRRRSFYEIGPYKLCKGKLCTQSDNLLEKKVVHSDNIDLKHLPTCNCQECKGVKKPAFRGKMPRQTKDTKNSQSKKKKVDKKYRRKETSRPSLKKEKRKSNSNKALRKLKRPKNEADDIATALKHSKEQEKLERRKLAQKLRNKKIYEIKFNKELKKRKKLDKKREKQAAKERRKAIKIMQKKVKEEPIDTNFCTACTLGLLKLGIKGVLLILYVIFYIITSPKKSYWYVRDRIRDPEGTYIKIRNWFRDAILIKKLEISETIRGSDTLTILADHFMDSDVYQAMANKGRTKKEQMVFQQKNKARKRRIRKREQQAINSCRHMLLTTLRQTPCLWVYHICPNFYPQCLSLLAFMRSFSRILLFLVAFACWTPCILSFELCRAFLCCFMCTG